jgi:DNA helicase-2/ATP-dependent DNA helicase PcrA
VPFDDQLTQAAEIARFVVEAREHGYAGGDIAVLIRTNAQAAHLENAFVAAKLPYWCQGGGFFDRMECGDVMAYLRLAVDPTDEGALRRIINRPTRYLGKAFVDEVVRESSDDLIAGLTVVDSYSGRRLSSRQIGAAADLAGLLNSLRLSRNVPPAAAASRVIDWTGYVSWLATNEGAGAAGDDSRTENLNALVEIAGEYSALDKLVEFADTSAALNRDSGEATEICTVHRSKGREWPIVIVSNFYEGSIPHARSLLDGNREDERRVAYVAWTRARNALIIAVPLEDVFGEEADPSSFLDEAQLEMGGFADDRWWGDALITPEERAKLDDLARSLAP